MLKHATRRKLHSKPKKSKKTTEVPKLGAKLGGGAYKSAYEVVGDPSKVVLVGNGSWGASTKDFHREAKELAHLKSLGLPVLKVHKVFEHKNTAYMITERCSVAFKGSTDDYTEQNRKAFSIASQKTIDSCAQINKQMNAHRIDIGDFQYLWRGDGTIVISDPRSITTSTAKEWKSYYPDGHPDFISQPSEIARYAMAVKSKRVRAKLNNEFFWKLREKAHDWCVANPTK